MQIEQVRYERRMSDGNYGNRMMSASAQVDEGDSPSDVLMLLRDVVVARLAEDEERERVEAAQRDAARLALYDAERAQRLTRRHTEVSGSVDIVDVDVDDEDDADDRG